VGGGGWLRSEFGLNGGWGYSAALHRHYVDAVCLKRDKRGF
jgi:hypothetical protein